MINCQVLKQIVSLKLYDVGSKNTSFCINFLQKLFRLEIYFRTEKLFIGLHRAPWEHYWPHLLLCLSLGSIKLTWGDHLLFLSGIRSAVQGFV